MQVVVLRDIKFYLLRLTSSTTHYKLKPISTIIPSLSDLNALKGYAEIHITLARCDNDLPVTNLAQKVFTPSGVKLGKNVVKEEYGIFTAIDFAYLTLGKLHCKRQGTLLPL